MERTIFLEENKSKISVNSESNVSIELNGKQRLLPFDDVAETMSLYELYNRQRDDCTKFRLIFNVSPYCTNVLFNTRTEVVWQEGSNNAVCLNTSSITASNSTVFPNGTINTTERVDIKQAIRDTEYSHPEIGGFVYHCGVDIFNNHLLRSEDFLHAQKANDGKNEETFNTIRDYIVDNSGEVVSERGGRSFRKMGYSDRHMYQYDNCLTMTNAYLSKISEENGWYGFINSGYINVPNAKLDGKDVFVNRVMNNNKPCEFYDMYPDRSLFSFIPKVNKYRHRLEHNWDYIITYPSENSKKAFNIINGTYEDNETEGLNALKCIEVTLAYTNNGNKLIRFKTLFSNGLSKGDYVRIYYNDPDNGGAMTRFYSKVGVYSVGDYEGYNTDKYFSVSYDDVSEFITISTDDNGEETANYVQCFIRQERNGVEFEYYIRIFNRIENNAKVPASEINKAGYQETIYGDRTAQIIYTDDIDVAGRVDNLGRPLTELYLTFVKRNRGYKKWYYGNNTTDGCIEFSHCFGKVTSGFDFGNDTVDYNIRKIHNINFKGLQGTYANGTREMFGWMSESGIPRTLETMKDEYGNTHLIEPVADTCNNDGGLNGNWIRFYGDAVAFDPYNYIEYVLMPVYHRFNTAQREYTGTTYADVFTDYVLADDFDYGDENNDGEIVVVTLPDPFINASADKTEVPGNGTGDDLTVRISVNCSPNMYTGDLFFRETIPGINMTRDGNDYVVMFNENNTGEDREVNIYGTLTTIEDDNYNGVASTDVDITIRQTNKIYPYGYEMADIVFRPMAMDYGDVGMGTIYVDKVTYYDEDREGQENVRTRERIEVSANDTVVWEPGNFPISVNPSDVFQLVSQSLGSANYKNNNEGDSITDITLKATYTNSDGKSCSGMVTGIILSAKTDDVFRYELNINPTSATATTRFNPSFTAERIKIQVFSAGTPNEREEVIQESDESRNVTSVSVWELDSALSAVADIINGRIIRKHDAQFSNDVNGVVTVKWTSPLGDELVATAECTIMPVLYDEFTINLENFKVTTPTNIVFSVLSFNDNDASFNRTSTYGYTITNEAISAGFSFIRNPEGNTTYKIKIDSCTGDGSSRVSFSLCGGTIVNWSQYNSYLNNWAFTADDLNGSTLKFYGGKSSFSSDTTEATDFGSIMLTIKGHNNVTTTYSTSDYIVSGISFYSYDIMPYDPLSNGNERTNNINVLIGGGIKDGAKYTGYTLTILKANGSTLYNRAMSDTATTGTNVLILENGELFFRMGDYRDLFNSKWIIKKGVQPVTYGLNVTPNGATVQYNETRQYTAILTSSNGSTTDVTSDCTWELSNNNVATISDNGLLTNKNTIGSDYYEEITAKYKNSDIEIEKTVNATLKCYNPPPDTGGSIYTIEAKEYSGRLYFFTTNDTPIMGVSDYFSYPNEIKVSTDPNKGISVLTVNFIAGDTTEYILGDTVNVYYAKIYEGGNWISDIGGPHKFIEEDVNLNFNGGRSFSAGRVLFGLDSEQGNDPNQEQPDNPNEEPEVNPDEGGGPYIPPTTSTTTGKIVTFNRTMLNEADEGNFTVCGETLNWSDGNRSLNRPFLGNLNPEGYFYNPNNRVKIREISNTISSVDGIVINSDFSYVETGTAEDNRAIMLVSAISPTNMDFVEGMEFVFYKKSTGVATVSRLVSFDENYPGGGCLICLWVRGINMATLKTDLMNGKYILVLKKDWCPSYAIYQPKLRKFIWREIISPSKLTQDSDIYDMPFANGRFYIQQNINFFLRRQDPQNIYQLQSPDTEKYNPLKKFRIVGREKIDPDDITYFDDAMMRGC